MTSALHRLEPAAVLTQWTLQPLAIVLATLLLGTYLYGLRRAQRRWPRWRISVFAIGFVLFIWSTCGVLEVYRDSLYWVWTAQTLVLWLVVPIMMLSGHPVQLALALHGPDSAVARVLRSRFCRVIANPLVGPALVPLLSAVLFFGPLPAWTIKWDAAGWLFEIALLAVGALMVLPLAGLDEDASSLAVGLSLAIGSFELVLDALPGVVLRLRTGLVTSWFDHRAQHSWTPDALHDQRVAGAILWCIAEIIDLPFLVLVYRRWIRADARDAAEEDAVLEAERAARTALPSGESAAPARDAPWWLSDPALQRRFRDDG
jgi:cytochrome c oxidase assembly factor CtaG